MGAPRLCSPSTPATTLTHVYRTFVGHLNCPRVPYVRKQRSVPMPSPSTSHPSATRAPIVSLGYTLLHPSKYLQGKKNGCVASAMLMGARIKASAPRTARREPTHRYFVSVGCSPKERNRVQRHMPSFQHDDGARSGANLGQSWSRRAEVLNGRQPRRRRAAATIWVTFPAPGLSVASLISSTFRKNPQTQHRRIFAQPKHRCPCAAASPCAYQAPAICAPCDRVGTIVSCSLTPRSTKQRGG